MLHRMRGVRRVVAIIVCAALVAACGPTPDKDESQLADAYILVLEWVLAVPDYAPNPEPDELPLVFIESLSIDAIEFGVQVDIVGYFEERVDVRFIDIRAEALEEIEGAPVRDGGILLGLGDMSIAEPRAIRGEVYQTADRISGYRFRVDFDGETAMFAEAPEPVEPEVLDSEP